MSSSKFSIEKVFEKKKIQNNFDEKKNFCTASNFDFPYQISLSEGNESVDILFDKILMSNNFYIALDEPILPQVCGNYAIVWRFRYEILPPVYNTSKILVAVIKTSCCEEKCEFSTNDSNILEFNCIIQCKGFAAGDGIIFEIQSKDTVNINLITNKVSITYESSFD